MDSTGTELSGNMSWYEVWREVFFRPTQATFARILADPAASPRRAYTWVALVALVGGLIQTVVVQFTGANPFTQTGMSPIITLLCGILVAPLVAVVALAIGAGIFHWVAQLFGGTGTYDSMVYAYGAVSAPVSFISALLSPLTTSVAQPGGGNGSTAALCLAPVTLALALYTIYLYVQAVKAVARIDTGKALLVVLLPTFLMIGIVFACILLLVVPVIIQTTGGL